MEVNDLSFDGIVRCLNEVIAKIDDPRSASNATKYSLREAILGAFAAFFMQLVSGKFSIRHFDRMPKSLALKAFQ